MSRPAMMSCLPFLMAAVVLIVVAPFVGPFDAWHGYALSDEGRMIVFRLRLPRAVVGFAVGGILATSGLACQALVRNFLATPSTLGVSSGAALGASVVIVSGVALPAINAPFVGAVAGAALTTGILFWLITIYKGNSSNQVVLIGILINYLVSSLILFIQYVADPIALSRIVLWLIGSVRPVPWIEAVMVSLASVCLLGLVWSRAPDLNALVLGRDAAETRGIDVRSLERSLLVGTSVGVGAAVASCGGIGFVGILEPQLCRRFVGSDYRLLVPAVFLLGGSVVVAADLVGRVLLAPLEIPAGVLTALIEIPVGLLLMVQTERRR